MDFGATKVTATVDRACGLDPHFRLLRHRRRRDSQVLYRQQAFERQLAGGEVGGAPFHAVDDRDHLHDFAAEFLDAVAGGERRGPDFREAWEIQKIIDTAVRSSKLRTWQAIE